MRFDKEEKEILDAYEKGDIKTRYPSKKELTEVKIAAENTFKKNRRVTIRLYDHDFKGIQKKAMEKGIPYQTLISSMIHQYIEGELVEKEPAGANAVSEKKHDFN
jgi:predicted DNA binding CopG/RHH family protein